MEWLLDCPMSLAIRLLPDAAVRNSRSGCVRESWDLRARDLECFGSIVSLLGCRWAFLRCIGKIKSVKNLGGPWPSLAPTKLRPCLYCQKRAQEGCHGSKHFFILFLLLKVISRTILEIMNILQIHKDFL